jgi:hypothetical protein
LVPNSQLELKLKLRNKELSANIVMKRLRFKLSQANTQQNELSKGKSFSKTKLSEHDKTETRSMPVIFKSFTAV